MNRCSVGNKRGVADEAAGFVGAMIGKSRGAGVGLLLVRKSMCMMLSV